LYFRQGILLGLGHPLLDITAHVEPEFLDKYGLEPNNAIRATKVHIPMYEDLVRSHYKIDLVAGGAVQNTLRVVQVSKYPRTLVGYCHMLRI
jgi:adenosine kinase